MDDEIEDGFTETLGLILQSEGMPRIAGRLMGLFVLRGGPFSFGELAERLQISRGSVSTNTRLLEDFGILERVSVAGERQDFFRLAPDPYARLIARKNERARHAREAIQRASKGIGQDDADGAQRVAELSDFFGVLIETTDAALDRIEKGAIDLRDGNDLEMRFRETPTIPSDARAEAEA